MKKHKFESRSLRIAHIFAHRSTAFWIAIIGILVQVFHNWLTAYVLSSFSNESVRIMQAILLSSFLSSALLFFVLNADADDEYSKANTFVKWFALFEIATNLYYYFQTIIYKPLLRHYQLIEQYEDYKILYKNDPDLSSKLLEIAIDPLYHFSWLIDVNIPAICIAVVFSIALPLTIKAYAGEIRIFHTDIEDDETETEAQTLTKATTVLDEIRDKYIEILQVFDGFYARLEMLEVDNDNVQSGIKAVFDTLDFRDTYAKKAEDLASIFETDAYIRWEDLDCRLIDINLKLKALDSDMLEAKIEQSLSNIDTQAQLTDMLNEVQDRYLESVRAITDSTVQFIEDGYQFESDSLVKSIKEQILASLTDILKKVFNSNHYLSKMIKNGGLVQFQVDGTDRVLTGRLLNAEETAQ